MEGGLEELSGNAIVLLRNVQFNMSLCQAEDDQKRINDAMKSFPSGHTQLSCFSAVFTIVSLERGGVD